MLDTSRSWPDVPKVLPIMRRQGKLNFQINSRINPSNTVLCIGTFNSSARYGHWHKDKAQTAIKNVPRVIVFVVGGASFSEMRCAYEVTAQTKNWEIIVGSSHILTPEIFLSDLGSLSKED